MPLLRRRLRSLCRTSDRCAPSFRIASTIWHQPDCVGLSQRCSPHACGPRLHSSPPPFQPREVAWSLEAGAIRAPAPRPARQSAPDRRPHFMRRHAAGSLVGDRHLQSCFAFQDGAPRYAVRLAEARPRRRERAPRWWVHRSATSADSSSSICVIVRDSFRCRSIREIPRKRSGGGISAGERRDEYR